MGLQCHFSKSGANIYILQVLFELLICLNGMCHNPSMAASCQDCKVQTPSFSCQGLRKYCLPVLSSPAWLTSSLSFNRPSCLCPSPATVRSPFLATTQLLSPASPGDKFCWRTILTIPDYPDYPDYPEKQGLSPCPVLLLDFPSSVVNFRGLTYMPQNSHHISNLQCFYVLCHLTWEESCCSC